jgi:hypothetical protein
MLTDKSKRLNSKMRKIKITKVSIMVTLRNKQPKKSKIKVVSMEMKEAVSLRMKVKTMMRHLNLIWIA